MVLAIDGELDVDVARERCVHEIDLSVILIVRLAHVEGVAIAGGQIVEARVTSKPVVMRIANIIVLLVALVAMMSGDAFGGAAALARFSVAVFAVAVARARLTNATVRWSAIESFATILAVFAFGVTLARLQTNVGVVQASAVAIALADGTGGEVPMVW